VQRVHALWLGMVLYRVMVAMTIPPSRTAVARQAYDTSFSSLFRPRVPQTSLKTLQHSRVSVCTWAGRRQGSQEARELSEDCPGGRNRESDGEAPREANEHDHNFLAEELRPVSWRTDVSQHHVPGETT
jgi:hypothetical protein